MISEVYLPPWLFLKRRQQSKCDEKIDYKGDNKVQSVPSKSILSLMLRCSLTAAIIPRGDCVEGEIIN